MRMPVKMADVTRAVDALKSEGKTPSITAVIEKIREMSNDAKAGSRPTISRMLAKIRDAAFSNAIPDTEANIEIAEHLTKVHAYVHTASARIAEASSTLKALRAELAALLNNLESALQENLESALIQNAANAASVKAVRAAYKAAYEAAYKAARKSPEQRTRENERRRERYANDAEYRAARLGHAYKSYKKRKAKAQKLA